jgi:hypothetical protein
MKYIVKNELKKQPYPPNVVWHFFEPPLDQLSFNLVEKSKS